MGSQITNRSGSSEASDTYGETEPPGQAIEEPQGRLMSRVDGGVSLDREIDR